MCACWFSPPAVYLGRPNRKGEKKKEKAFVLIVKALANKSRGREKARERQMISEEMEYKQLHEYC